VQHLRDASGHLLRGKLLDLRNFKAIGRHKWTEAGAIGFGTKQRPTSAANCWTLTVLVNQLRLRNDPNCVSEFRCTIAKLDADRSAMFLQAWEMLLQKDKTLKVTGTREVILKRLEAVLTLEKQVADAGKAKERRERERAQRVEQQAQRAQEELDGATGPDIEGEEQPASEPTRSKRRRVGNAPYDPQDAEERRKEQQVAARAAESVETQPGDMARPKRQRQCRR